MSLSKCEQKDGVYEYKKRKRCEFMVQIKDELASIYAYCLPNGESCVNNTDNVMYDPNIHGKVVYVGQTIQSIKTRDRQHINKSSTKFDKVYTTYGQYVLVLMNQKKFIPSNRNSDTYISAISEWLDYNEKYYIEKFDTYRNGMNSTKGGQGQLWLMIQKESIAKQTYVRFKNIYMSMFEECYAKYGTVNVKHRSTEYKILGELISNIRQGYTTIPLEFRDKLHTMGLCTELHGLYNTLQWGYLWMGCEQCY